MSYVKKAQIRRADNQNDQLVQPSITTTAQVGGTAVTDEDFQTAVISQIKQIIFGLNPGFFYDDFSLAGIKNLTELTAAISSLYKTQIPLIGVQDGVNTVFTIPDKVINVPGFQSVDLFHNGRRLLRSDTPTSEIGDYILSESGGPSTGFDTVQFLSFSPYPSPRSTVRISYIKKP